LRIPEKPEPLPIVKQRQWQIGQKQPLGPNSKINATQILGGIASDSCRLNLVEPQNMRVSASSIIAKPADMLFWLSQDYTRRLEWDKYLCEAYLLGGHEAAAVGIESHCKNRRGSVLVSKYISFSPPTHAAVQMTKGPWILRNFSGTWRFKPLPDGKTEVLFIYNFKARPALLGWLVEPLIAAFYRRDMRRRLDALREWTQAIK